MMAVEGKESWISGIFFEIDQRGIGDDLDIGIKRREESERLLHFCLKHLGG